MRRTIAVLILLIPLASLALPQTPEPVDCPSIAVRGPAGIVSLGELAGYTALIDKGVEEPALEFIWSISSGLIKEGQGTKSIKIAQPNSCLTVTVKVKGLPAGCPSEASESSCADPGPEPIKIDELQKDQSVDHLNISLVTSVLRDHPNNSLYILAGDIRGENSDSLRRTSAEIMALLSQNGIPSDRITLTRVYSDVAFFQFWRVPPGAEPPRCHECEELEKDANQCPLISMTGPSRIFPPGESARFTVELPSHVVAKLRFDWTVSVGTIELGLGTREITVRTSPRDSSKTINAKVVIRGLAKECRNIAEREAVVIGTWDPVLIDEFGKIGLREQLARLDTFLNVLIENPSQNGYFVLRYVKGTPESSIQKRVKTITDHIFGRRRFPKGRIVIFSELSKQDSTQIYRLPPETGDSICSDCRVH